MKVAVLILAVAIVGAFAQDTTTPVGIPPFVCTSSNSFVCTFQKLGHQIKYHATKLGGKLKDVGTSILGSVLDQGKNLLASGSQAVLGTVLEHLNKEGLVGKREIAFMDKVKAHLKNGFDKLKSLKDGLHAAFKKAVTKLTGFIADTASLKKVEADTDKKIDAAVDEFNKDGKMGFFGMAKAMAGKIRDIFKAGMDKLREKYGKKMEARALLDLWNKAKGHLSSLAGSVSDTFKPHLDALKTGVAGLAAKAKEHGGKLVDAAKASFEELKKKLSGHIDTLKGHAGTLGTHATNAVNALKEAVASIAKQALDNAKGTLTDAVKTGTDAAGVIAGHVGDAVKA